VEIIEGYAAAQARLSRRTSFEFGKISPGARQKDKEIFGRDIGPAEAVEQILNDIRQKGDAAVFDYTLRIDGWKPAALEIPREQISASCERADPELVSSLKLAGERIRLFHQMQKESIWHGVTGDEWGQLVRPLERVGFYAPASSAIYPSTVLMTVIPARVAGVKEIILVTPPRDKSSIPPATLAAASIAGVDRVFGIGGAQAIGAMAYGTESVPKVDKICGPGNLFVMLAKKAVYGAVDIDALQGPSEVLIVADESANAEYCAADLLAQAEHDALPQAVLVTTSQKLAGDVEKELVKQLEILSRKRIISDSLENRGVIAIVDKIEEAIDLANLYAPEHLELMVDNADSYLDKITSAGCIFVGENSTVPMGDYIMGPSHSLPTGGTARFSSPLNIADFIKFIDVVKVSRNNLKNLGKAAMTIAMAEGLDAHARAIELRLRQKPG
jgi:histidinol dehydrogenase